VNQNVLLNFGVVGCGLWIGCGGLAAWGFGDL